MAMRAQLENMLRPRRGDPANKVIVLESGDRVVGPFRTSCGQVGDITSSCTHTVRTLGTLEAYSLNLPWPAPLNV